MPPLISSSETEPQQLSFSSQRIPSGKAFWRQLFSTLAVVALGFASYFLITRFVLQSVEVVGVSMLPTLQNSQHYLLNRWIFHVRKPRHGDVVVLLDPVDHSYAVKRIIASAGDSVFLKDGHVYINGKCLNEPYLRRGMPTFPYLAAKEQSFHCGDDQYFVLGDNRLNSADSRTYGAVPRRNILGLIVR